MSPSLGSALSGRDNALGAVRLVLAAAVILGHSWSLGGYEDSRLQQVADVAVSGFFALSGYLIAGSRVRTDLITYASRRARRILPGFWVALLVVALVFAPLGGLVTGRGWEPGDSLDYVLGNGLLVMTEHSIGATLAGAPSPGQWNGSLWTLMYELGAYLLCGALLGIPWVRRHLLATSAVLALGIPALAWTLGDLPGSLTMLESALRLFGFFAAGMLAYALRDRLRPSTPAALAATALVLGLAVAGPSALHLLGTLPLTYLLLHVGATWQTTLGSGADHSYGLYVYGWPVQQLLALLGVGALLPVWGFAAVSVALTLPLAAVSWRLAERPALRAGRAAPVTLLPTREMTVRPATSLDPHHSLGSIR
ncbi:acyltransferase [Janibacter alkaliphilus]|uniref:Peptidoglycan/LPS O-acetylase OafA/YrhL n=1 Tax=Janibacter alkaliphilus TaxID=1069963 RepID=A0A852X347_9MICO|nr:acyltransferase [Janibacter alkaliphilus]NYG36897.1 peptidoglycan/LPS O-acetylase OafA/YrhL [Janibacter alkaliphilus]